jgi:hypothetical protein
MIDEFFASKRVVVENGRRQRRHNLEIILLRLSNKATAGNIRALKVLLMYKDFAATRSRSGWREN